MTESERRQVSALLQRGAWFGSLSGPLQDGLLGIATMHAVPRGHVIQMEGDQGVGLAAVLSGSIQLLRHAGREDAMLLHIGEPGFWFGQYAVLGWPTTASAVARCAVTLLIVPPLAFAAIAREHPQLERRVHDQIHEYTDTVYRYQAESTGLPPGARLRRRLADLAHRRRVELGVRGRAVTLAVTQAELASMVGLARQQVNARLQELQRAGWLALAPGLIRVIDPEGLREASGPHRAEG